MAPVLMVDDDASIRHMLRDLFEGKHLCHFAETAEQALARLNEEAYDMVLTDVSMPGLSGLELLAHIRLRWPDTPVIIISAIDYQQYSGELIKMGAFDYLVKPFQLKELEESVARAVEHRRWLIEKPRRSRRRKASRRDGSKITTRASGG